MMGRNLVGHFSNSSSDLSSLTLSGLFDISQTNNSKWYGEISLKESIGKNDSMAPALTPMVKKNGNFGHAPMQCRRGMILQA